jgi:hypothetical protein
VPVREDGDPRPDGAGEGLVPETVCSKGYGCDSGGPAAVTAVVRRHCGNAAAANAAAAARKCCVEILRSCTVDGKVIQPLAGKSEALRPRADTGEVLQPRAGGGEVQRRWRR